MAHPDPEHIDTIFLTYLQGNAAGLDAELGEPPENPSPAYPHFAVIPLSPFNVEGGLNDPNALHVVDYQVSSVGLYAQQARGGIAEARDRLDGATIDFTAAGYKQAGAIQIVPGPAFSSDQADKPPLFMAHETYRFMVSPV